VARLGVSTALPGYLHTAGLVGGGKWPRPGEVSLAHDGVLFLDELPEFRFEAIEMLSAVLKVGSWCGFPAAPRLVLAAANPCPCGYLGATNRTCRCSEKQIATHRARIQRMANLLELTEVSL
jgi:magnesium chelatase family protein